MIELGTAVSELLKGKRVVENLPVYTGGLMAMYKRVAYLRLALNYYTFSEIYYELNKDTKAICNNEVKALQELVLHVILNEDISSLDAESQITALRDEIISKMDGVTAYADKLGLYEYILNRVEFRFKDCEFDNNYYRNNFETDIYNYVTEDKDNSAINMRLSMVMGELPMRLSRNKFFDVLRDSFSIYKGSERLAVNDFVYRIKTVGGIYSTEGMDKKFSKLKKAIDEFQGVDYQMLSEKEYELYRSKLDKATELTLDYSDSFMTLAEIVNDMYSIILCDKALCDVEEKASLKEIIEHCYHVIEGDVDPDIEWAERFVNYEGLQEKLRYKLDGPENALTEIYNTNKAIIDAGSENNNFIKLDMVSKLQSSSNFVTFEEAENLREEASEEYINQVVEALIEEFSELFKDSGRTYMRAVMAGVISNLPAYFNNLKEFEEYVHVSLNQCSDEAEQKACMTVINMLMASE